MRHHMEFMEELTEEELGFDVMADPVVKSVGEDDGVPFARLLRGND